MIREERREKAAGDERSGKLGHDERQDFAAGHELRTPQAERHGRVHVRPRDTAHGVDHGHDDEAERERNAHVADLAGVRGIEDDGAGAGEDENERAEELGAEAAVHVE